MAESMGGGAPGPGSTLNKDVEATDQQEAFLSLVGAPNPGTDPQFLLARAV